MIEFLEIVQSVAILALMLILIVGPFELVQHIAEKKEDV